MATIVTQANGPTFSIEVSAIARAGWCCLSEGAGARSALQQHLLEIELGDSTGASSDCDTQQQPFGIQLSLCAIKPQMLLGISNTTMAREAKNRILEV